MGTSELKSSLFALIEQANDDAMLRAIHELLANADLASESNSSISKEEQVSIEKGLSEIENGRVVSNETVMKNARNRVKEFKRRNG